MTLSPQQQTELHRLRVKSDAAMLELLMSQIASTASLNYGRVAAGLQPRYDMLEDAKQRLREFHRRALQQQ